MDQGWILERMARYGNQTAIVWNDQPFPYAALLDKVASWKNRLDGCEFVHGEVVALEGDFSPEACALFLALIDKSAIIVPITKASEAHREEFMRVAEVQFVVAFDNTDGWHIERRGALVTNPLTRQLRALGQPGLILFSSGSTGKSKAALHNFTSLLEKFKMTRNRIRLLTFLLLDHIGGINTLLYALSNGGTVVSVTSRDPELVCRAISLHQVQLLPTSPTFLNMLLVSEAYMRYDLSSLELITYGTEVMPESTLRRIRNLFPGVRLQQTYGLSELGILRSKSRDSDSLWVKVGGENVETKVVNGTLWVRTKSAMIGYLNAPSPFDQDGWMNTEDIVEVEGEYIRILGRRSEIINVGGQKVYPAEVESVLMQMDNVRDTTVHGENNPLTGSIVAARISLFEPEELSALKKRMRAFCSGKLAPHKVPVKVEITNQDQFSPRYKKIRRGPVSVSQSNSDAFTSGFPGMPAEDVTEG